MFYTHINISVLSVAVLASVLHLNRVLFDLLCRTLRFIEDESEDQKGEGEPRSLSKGGTSRELLTEHTKLWGLASNPL